MYAAVLCLAEMSTAAVEVNDLTSILNSTEKPPMANESRPPPIRKGIGKPATSGLQLHPNSAEVQAMFDAAYSPNHPAHKMAQQRATARDRRDARKLYELQRRLEERGK